MVTTTMMMLREDICCVLQSKQESELESLHCVREEESRCGQLEDKEGGSDVRERVSEWEGNWRTKDRPLANS